MRYVLIILLFASCQVQQPTNFNKDINESIRDGFGAEADTVPFSQHE